MFSLDLQQRRWSGVFQAGEWATPGQNAALAVKGDQLFIIAGQRRNRCLSISFASLGRLIQNQDVKHAFAYCLAHPPAPFETTAEILVEKLTQRRTDLSQKAKRLRDLSGKLQLIPATNAKRKIVLRNAGILFQALPVFEASGGDIASIPSREYLTPLHYRERYQAGRRHYSAQKGEILSVFGHLGVRERGTAKSDQIDFLGMSGDLAEGIVLSILSPIGLEHLLARDSDSRGRQR